jgi:hypothetical protein
MNIFPDEGGGRKKFLSQRRVRNENFSSPLPLLQKKTTGASKEGNQPDYAASLGENNRLITGTLPSLGQKKKHLTKEKYHDLRKLQTNP